MPIYNAPFAINRTPMTDLIKVAVIGVGHLGKWHAQKYANAADCELVAVVDTDEGVARQFAEQYACQAVTDYRSVIDQVDAISLVVPTSHHYKIGREFLEAGIHCLIEKPITETTDEAEQLIKIAEANQLILQVGHIERFNAVMSGVRQHIDQPQFIESTRLAPFNQRANDVSVILDLMIHDIDIILDLVDSPIRHISASGISVLTDTVDIANARLEFDNHCVANVTASRISQKLERKLRIFQKDAYLSADLQNRVLAVNRKSPGAPAGDPDGIQHEEFTFDDNDALNLEVLDFIKAIRSGKPPAVSGSDGKRALQTAIDITSQIKEQL